MAETECYRADRLPLTRSSEAMSSAAGWCSGPDGVQLSPAVTRTHRGRSRAARTADPAETAGGTSVTHREVRRLEGALLCPRPVSSPDSQPRTSRAGETGRSTTRSSCPVPSNLIHRRSVLRACFMLMGRSAGLDRPAELSHAVLRHARRRLRPRLVDWMVSGSSRHGRPGAART